MQAFLPEGDEDTPIKSRHLMHLHCNPISSPVYAAVIATASEAVHC